MSRYIITGMSCAACAARVEKAVGNIPGVDHVAVSLLTNSMGVEGSASAEEITEAVRKAGYNAFPEKKIYSRSSGTGSAGDAVRDIEPSEYLKDNETPVLKQRLILSLIVLAFLLYISMGFGMFGLPLPSFLSARPIMTGFIECILSLIIILINQNFFISGAKGIANKTPNMDTLVSLGAGAAWIYSICVLAYMMSGQETGNYTDVDRCFHNLYFESSGMILTLITVGKLLEARAKGKTTNALKSLLDLTPRSAFVIRDEIETEIPVSHMKTGDIFTVKPGGEIPADGIILEGTGFVNESVITGESIPREVSSGDKIISGTVNTTGYLKCKAEKVGDETTLARIIDLVREASTGKAPAARTADRISAVFVPVVILIAAVTLLVWLITGRDIGFALSRGISVLVISCPCALGLATPVAVMVGSGKGALNGVFFRTAEALEIAGNIEVAALDKTGTITYGNPELPDQVRDHSAEAVRQLNNMGIRTMMITGDKYSAAEKIARDAGIDDVIAAVLPDQKEKIIRDLKADYITAMVGDGVNDAPALTTADIGIAIGSGTDIAISSADIILAGSDPLDIPAAIRLSRVTLRIIKQNLFWALCYNCICIPIAAGVFQPLFGWTLSPAICAAAMSISSFCVVSNALRLNTVDIYDDRKGRKQGKNHKRKYKQNGMNNISTAAAENAEQKDIKPYGEDNMKKTVKIEGMMCPHCEANVKKTLENIEGISKAEVSHKEGTAVITCEKEISGEIVQNAIEEAGYTFIGIE